MILTTILIPARLAVQAGAHVGRRRVVPLFERQQPGSFGLERRGGQERASIGGEDLPVHG